MQTLFSKALFKEFEQKKHLLFGKSITSIYFGGGTPTQMPSAFYAQLLDLITQNCTIDNTCEITIEANPEDLTKEYAQHLSTSRIHRISFGVQAFQPHLLNLLGRRAHKNTCIEAIDIAYTSNIHNISIDLMYEVPNQTVLDFQQSLQHIQTLPITHISIYNLTFEPNTPFKKRETHLAPLLPKESETIKMLACLQNLSHMGFKRYEISAFAKPGFESKHNLGYWTARPFLGFGPSAFSYWNSIRFKNENHLINYCKNIENNRPTIDFSELLEKEARIKELLAVQLRTLDGVNLNQFKAQHGSLSKELHGTIQQLIDQNLLEHSDRLKLTEKGLDFYDSVAQAII